MKKIIFLLFALGFISSGMRAASFLHNDYAYLQEITFELYTDDVPAYKVPEQMKSIEETLMFEILHATWKDKHWVAYTLNKNLLGSFKVGQPALLDDGKTKKIFFVAAFPGSVGGLDLYVSENTNGTWSKPKNLGKNINTSNNESNPGLLNDYTLTYSSGGIIKKLDLNTLKVVDLQEANVDDTKSTETKQNTISNKQDESKKDKDIVAAIGDNSTAAPTGTTIDNNVGAIGDNSTAMPANNGAGKGTMENPRSVNDQIIVQEKKIEEAPMSKTQRDNTTVNTNTPAPQQNKNAGFVNPSAPATTMKANTTLVNTVVQSLGSKTREEMLAKYKTAIQLGAFSEPKWELFEQLSKFGKLVTYKNDKNMSVIWITGFANRAAAESVLPQVKSIAGFENAYVTGK